MGLFDVFKSKKKETSTYEEELYKMYSTMYEYTSETMKHIPKEKYNASANYTVTYSYFYGAFDVYRDLFKITNEDIMIGMFSAYLGKNFKLESDEDASNEAFLTYMAASKPGVFQRHREAGKKNFINWYRGNNEATKELLQRLY